MLISSSPSAEDTTSARSVPKRRNAPARTPRNEGSLTPMTWRLAPAGLVSGPRKLKIVRTASSLRTGTTKRVAPWCAGANMKPKPTSRMQRPTAPGSRSMRAPSASSRSAEPQSEVAERLPCLATAQPAPAAIRAAVVDTLKVAFRRPCRRCRRHRARRRPRASRASAWRWRGRRPRPRSPPFARSPTRNAEISISEASPAMIVSRTSFARPAARSWPAATSSIARVSVGLGIRRPRGSCAAAPCLRL